MNFRRHLRGAELPLFQVSPLLNVVFLLLCLYLAVAVLDPAAREQEIQLPAIASGQPVQHVPGELIVRIASTGVLQLGRQTLTLDELRARLGQLSRDVPDSVVLVRADRDTPFAQILGVLDACRSAEIDKCSFVTMPSEREAAPARVPDAR